MINNELSVQIFSTGTTPIYDASEDVVNASGLYFRTGFPGGLYLDGGMFIPKDPRRWWDIDGTLRVIVRNGIEIVYEGFIPSLQDRFSQDEIGVYVPFMGAWGWHLMRRDLRKRWADDRTTEQPWEYMTDTATYAGADICTVDRRARLYFLPKAEAWANNAYAAVQYYLAHDAVERVTYDYDFAEGGQQWEISLWRSTDGAAWTLVDEANGDTIAGAGTTTQITATGSGSIDATIAGTPDWLEFRFYSRAAQTPTSDGTYYAAITNLMVYSEDESAANDVNLASIATDIVGQFTTILNSDTQYIDTAGTVRVIEPFITQGDSYESLASILMRAAEYGDGDENSWGVGVYHSEKAATPDGLPVLYVKQYPVTTAYDYFVAVDSPNIVGGIRITKDFEAELFNRARVEYRDESGKQQFVTPVEDASLVDSDSVTAYGQRDVLLRVGNSTLQNATDYGARFISKHADPRWIVDDFTVIGSIEGAGGQQIPACQIQAGKRVKIDGYDTFIISQAEYDHETKSARISIGEPKDPTFTESVFAPVWNDPTPQSEGGVGTQSNKAWWKRADLIGDSAVKRLKEQGKWQDWKRANWGRYLEIMKRRGK